MKLSNELQQWLKSGVHRLGEIEIRTDVSGNPFVICHALDAEKLGSSEFGGLKLHEGPADARAISTHDEEGGYRFAKAQTNLKRGWVMILRNQEELLQALDQFYPAAVGLAAAMRNGTLEVEQLRDKLTRQTGMYRFARNISDAGAQQLVREVCGPAHQCAKRILWQLDDTTPLDDSEASRFNGIPGEVAETKAIPLLCREACNHFVAECRKVSKAESDAAKSAG
jgi:sirohydrochlorin cobaltochelatase